jgi:hypothetical protein
MSSNHTSILHRLTSLFSSELLVLIRCLVCMLLSRLLFTCNWTKIVTAFTSHLELSLFGTDSRILPESRHIAFARPRTENPFLLLVSADRTENISRGSYCFVSTKGCRDVFTSALHSNGHGTNPIENSLSVEFCLPNRCLVMLWANPLQYITYILTYDTILVI